MEIGFWAPTVDDINPVSYSTCCAATIPGVFGIIRAGLLSTVSLDLWILRKDRLAR